MYKGSRAVTNFDVNIYVEDLKSNFALDDDYQCPLLQNIEEEEKRQQEQKKKKEEEKKKKKRKRRKKRKLAPQEEDEEQQQYIYMGEEEEQKEQQYMYMGEEEEEEQQYMYMGEEEELQEQQFMYMGEEEEEQQEQQYMYMGEEEERQQQQYMYMGEEEEEEQQQYMYMGEEEQQLQYMEEATESLSVNQPPVQDVPFLEAAGEQPDVLLDVRFDDIGVMLSELLIGDDGLPFNPDSLLNDDVLDEDPVAGAELPQPPTSYSATAAADAPSSSSFPNSFN